MGVSGEVSVAYHSFELAPDTPIDFEGSEVDFLARHKGMPADQVERMLDQMTKLAVDEGLAYDFDALRHTKTLKAHQVLHLAKTEGSQLAVLERLFRAYFEEGRHLGRDDELVALAAEAGLDPDKTRAVLRSASKRLRCIGYRWAASRSHTFLPGAVYNHVHDYTYVDRVAR